MNKKVKIVIPYFGKFPNTIRSFLLSCENNPEFEWVIYTDDCLQNVPKNVKVINCTLNDIKKKIEKSVGFEISLDAPYKLCDFRPAFGQIFSDELVNCDFWGYGDIDLVYGDLSNFITDEILDKYDKIYPCGHLSLIRNNSINNEAYKVCVDATLNYRDVFTDDRSLIFDEYKGVNEKIFFCGGRVYGCIDFADMDIVYSRFRTADKRTIKKVFPNYMFAKHLPKNYKEQVFYYDSTIKKAFRIYVQNGKIFHQELAYIHYRHKIDCADDIDYSKGFYITKNGIIQDERKLEKNLIIEHNYYPGKLFELKEYLEFYKKQMVIKLGSNILLRNIVRILKGKDIIQ